MGYEEAMDYLKDEADRRDNEAGELEELRAENARLREALEAAKVDALLELRRFVTPLGSWDEKVVPWDDIERRIRKIKQTADHASSTQAENAAPNPVASTPTT